MTHLYLLSFILLLDVCKLFGQQTFANSYMVLNVDTCRSILTLDRPMLAADQYSSALCIHASKSRMRDRNSVPGDLAICHVDSVHDELVYLGNDLSSIAHDVDYLQAIIPLRDMDLAAVDTISCVAWNDRFGGIIVVMDSILDLRGKVIDASCKGFRGGYQMFSDTTTSGVVRDTTLHPNGETFTWGDTSYSGIAGRPRNGGGSGGSGMMKGGTGGATTSALTPVQGGSVPHANYFRPALVFGSGGGAGHYNDLGRSDGGRGGGVVVVIADSLNTDATTELHASGQDGENIYADGAGGGGAGGCVAIHTKTTIVRASIDVSGGRGGNALSNSLLSGPGGGGAGGIVYAAPTMSFLQQPTISGGGPGTIIRDNYAAEHRGSLIGGRGAIVSMDKTYRQLPPRKGARLTLWAADTLVEYGESTTLYAYGDGLVRWLSKGLKEVANNSRAVETEAILQPRWFVAEFTSSTGCVTRDSIRVRPRTEAQTLLVEADYLRAHPGDTVDLFLRAELTAPYRRDLLGTIYVSTYSAMLHPLKSHHVRNARSHVRIPFTIPLGALSTFRREAAVVMLGDSLVTQISIDSVSVINASVPVRRKHGRLTLDSICNAGGAPRLFDPRQSPFTIQGRVIVTNADAVYVTDVLGREIRAEVTVNTGITTVRIPESFRGLVIISSVQSDRVYHLRLYY